MSRSDVESVAIALVSGAAVGLMIGALLLLFALPLPP